MREQWGWSWKSPTHTLDRSAAAAPTISLSLYRLTPNCTQ
jgi:hypothetical protein